MDKDDFRHPNERPTERDHNLEAGLVDLEHGMVEFEHDLVDVEATGIGAAARALDHRTIRERVVLPRSTLRRLVLLGLVYVLGIAGLSYFFEVTPSQGAFSLAIPVIVLAFTFEVMDSAAGMGFGTALAPLLLILGYDPLAVVPALLISETITGLLAGGVHHELKNASFSFRPLNDDAKLMILLAAIGAVASIGSILLAYFALTLSESFITLYVSVLVLVMGFVGLVRARVSRTFEYKPRRMVGFAALAGFNKGIGGGGFGPVITLGQVLSGIYEKSATAITSLSEGIVSLVGVATFLAITSAGVRVDLVLLPSIFTGGFLAAIAAPYLVRVLPNRVWRYVIPLYAFTIGVLALTIGLDV